MLDKAVLKLWAHYAAMTPALGRAWRMVAFKLNLLNYLSLIGGDDDDDQEEEEVEEGNKRR